MNIIFIKTWSEIPAYFTGIAIYPNGAKQWLNERKFHRLDGPAMEWLDGHKEWWVEGKCHRLDGPAVEQSNGFKHWYLEDQHYPKISLEDYVVLDHDKGKYELMWYKLLDEDKIFEYPDIPGLIEK